MTNCCCTIPTRILNECNYTPPIQKHLLLRKVKGKIQVKVNGKGKWINAEFDEENKIIRYTV